MDELLSTLGLLWSRLLLYPGGLAALGLAWLLNRLVAAPASAATGPAPSLLDLTAIAAPLIVLALLPLPGSALPLGLDLPLALMLLEWPALAHHACHGTAQTWMQRQRSVYAVLVLAGIVLISSAGGLDLAALAQAPAAGAGLALLAGATGWSIAATLAVDAAMYRGAALRRAGHLGLATCLWLPITGTGAWVLAPALGIGGLMMLVGRGRSAQSAPLPQILLVAAALQVLALAWLVYAASTRR